ncbi:fimbria/pilus outer membrane usher protein [Morganella psychrotolerans]|uniref:fimbria/pilus outer membrane usher protein n=1 Tax=Morganella psychrotolerans TaxID=368603 RepID=UPI0039AF3F8B
MKKHKIKNKHFFVLTIIPVSVFLSANHAFADDFFDPAFLSFGDNTVSDLDLSSYEKDDQLPPGEYYVNISVNKKFNSEELITFHTNKENKLVPLLTPLQLISFGVNVKDTPYLKNLPEDEPIINLSELIPDYQFTFNENKLDLLFSFPQIVMKNKDNGSTDPLLWDDGVPALILNYNVMGGKTESNGTKSENLFTQLYGGINFQAWRLRMNASNNYYKSSLNGKTTSNNNHDINNVRLYRDIKSLKSNLKIGEIFPSSDIFESFPIKGISLSSSNDMIPESLRGFAPTITGYANSNATVTVSQNNNVIYQTYVSPGPFSIDDIRQSQLSGELEITITEADGTVRKQIYASSGLPVMEREGGFKYEVSSGEYNSKNSKKKSFLLGAFSYGLPKNITVYGGALISEKYYSTVMGVGTSLGKFGALSVDITTSDTTPENTHQREKGQSYRIKYAKNMLSTGTTIDLAAYRYSTENYHDFNEINNFQYTDNAWTHGKQRSSLRLSVSQQLGKYGSVFVAGNREDFWDNKTVNNNLSMGYNGSLNNINYSLSYSIEKKKGDNNTWPEDRRWTANIQIPLSVMSNNEFAKNSSASYSLNGSRNASTTNNLGLRTSFLDNKVGLSLNQDYSHNSDQTNNTNLNANYTGNITNSSVGYSYGNNYNSLNANINGTIVLHEKGVIFSKQAGNTALVLIDAPGAGGTKINTGLSDINSNGQALVFAGNPYNKNSVALDVTTLPDNVEVDSSVINVYPTKDAVVLAKFKTKQGYQVLFTLSHNGNELPFGTIVSAEGDNTNSGIVGDSGQVYLSGLPAEGTILAKWGNSANQSCRSNYNLEKDSTSIDDDNHFIKEVSLQCQ